MKRLLEAAIVQHFGSSEAIPAELRPFIRAADGVCQAAEADRARLRESESLLRSVFDNVPCMMLVADLLDDDVRFVAVNEATFGLSTNPERASGFTLRERTPNLVERWLARYREVKLAGKPRRFEDELDFGHGARRLVTTVTPIAGASNRYVVVVEDVTEKRALETRLRLQDRMASMGTLAAGVAHEINNPLAYVVANLDAISERIAKLPPDLWADLPELVGEVRDGADRVRRIVRDLKTFSRPDEERREAIDLRRLLDSCINLATNEIRHRAQLVRHYENVPAIAGNSGRLGQVFLNLLINAAQSIPDGAAERNQVFAHVRQDSAEWVVVEIHDTGAGIAPEIRPHIFEPFFTTKPIGIGTGIGLAVCHSIVTGMGGEISVDSEVGKGSIFRVRLPCRPAATQSAPGHSPAEEKRSGRVLIVDDEPLVGRAVARLLGRHEVVVTHGAREALGRIVAGEHFDVLVCDLMMPDMTGIDLHTHLVGLGRGLERRMVFMTGGAFTSRAEEFLSQIPNARLDKPLDARELRRAVQDALT